MLTRTEASISIINLKLVHPAQELSYSMRNEEANIVPGVRDDINKLPHPV
jgi:hypothetical protein